VLHRGWGLPFWFWLWASLNLSLSVAGFLT
jgi:hypothetical protein